MAKIQKANVILEVADDLVLNYLDKGYNEIDENGKVIKHGVPNDLNQLRFLYCNQLKEIDSLKKEIEQLKKGNKKEAEPKKKKSADIE